MKIKDQLELHEGKRRFPYEDTVGKVTIGIGHNLTDKGLPDFIIDALFEYDLKEVVQNLDKSLPWWRTKPENVQNVLMDMCFNLGMKGLLGFKKFLSSVEQDDYATAKIAMMDSLWAKQVGKRAETLRDML